MGVGKVFGAWIVGRIEKYDFVEDDDYKVCFPKRENKKGSGGHNIKDYSLTLDMAKELSMVENNKEVLRNPTSLIKLREQKKII